MNRRVRIAWLVGLVGAFLLTIGGAAPGAVQAPSLPCDDGRGTPTCKYDISWSNEFDVETNGLTWKARMTATFKNARVKYETAGSGPLGEIHISGYQFPGELTLALSGRGTADDGSECPFSRTYRMRVKGAVDGYMRVGSGSGEIRASWEMGGFPDDPVPGCFEDPRYLLNGSFRLPVKLPGGKGEFFSSMGAALT